VTNSGDFGDSQELDRLKAMLESWRTSLVDLSGRNRLLNFRHTKSATLEISTPSAQELVDGLARGWDFAPLPDEEPEAGEGMRPSDVVLAKKGDRTDGIVTQKTTAPSLLRALNSLRAKATQVFNDYGLWTLNLGVGMLRWREDGAETGSDAPLILMPVVIERARNGRIRLRASDDEEPRLNPALKVKLEQFRIDWAPVAEQDPSDLQAVLSAAARAVAGKAGWQLSDRVVLALFASHKESMYQDLLDNESRVLGSDLVRAMALGPNSGLASDRFDFEEIELNRIDELSPPEDSPLVLDADASQRQAVAAAVAGQSFVLDGPPGTGKSQTITNMIAGLMHAGRSVLFVSEKAAALDVVLDRLKSVELDSYALALHSHNTSRKAVAQELGRALTEELRAPQLSQQTLAQARELRLALSAYAEAMNEVRDPLGRTLHDVLGRVGRLSEAPVAYLSHRDDTPTGAGATFRAETLSDEDLRLIVEATKAISEAWEAVADPSFPWRDLRAGLSHPRPVLEQAQAARDALTTAVDRYRDLAPGGVPVTDQSGIDRLIALLRLLDVRSPVPEAWLTTDAFADEVDDRADAFLAELRKVQRTSTAVRAAVAERWQELSTRLTAEPGEAEKTLSAMAPRGLDLAGLTEERARQLAGEFDATAGVLERTLQSLTGVSHLTGLTNPSSPEEARHLCDVIAVAGTEHRPLEQWLVPEGPARAEEAAVGAVADALRDFFTRRDRVLSAQALATDHTGPGWAELRREVSAERPANELALAALEPPGADIASLTGREAAELAERFDTLADALEMAAEHADSVAQRLGCDRPKATSEAEDLATLVELATASERTLEAWLEPRALPGVQAAVAEISSAAADLAAAEEAARDTFLPDIVSTPDLPEAVHRLTEGRQGLAGMLSSGIRADRKLVARLTHGGSWRGELYDKLPLADAWCAAHRELRSLAATHAELIGRYRGTALPDVTALRKALVHAEAVHALAPETVADPYRRSLLATQLADGREPQPALVEQGTALRNNLATWRRDLGSPSLAPHAADLTKQPLDAAARWLRAHLAPLRQAVALLDTVASVGRRDRGPGSEHTLASARTAVTAAHAAQKETAAFAAQAVTDRGLLGPWYRGLDTQADDLHDAAPNGVTGYEPMGQLLLRRGLHLTQQQPGPYATEQQRELLGRYAPGGHPHTESLRAALDSARLIARLAPDTLAEPARRTSLVNVLADGRTEPRELLAQTDQIRRDLDLWQEYTGQPHVAAVGTALAARPLERAASWLRAHVEPFEEAADLIRSTARVMDEETGLTLSRAREAVAFVVSARAAESSFAENDATYRSLLGSLYQGTETDRDAILDALDWAQKVRRTAHGGHSAPLTQTAARLMLSASADPSVAARAGDWSRQREALAGHFEPERAEELRRELAESLTAAQSVLSRLDRDPFGPEAWTSCADALTLLRRYHLDGLPDQLARREVSAEDFPAAMERAVLTAWVEHQLTTDQRLKPMRAVERDQLVERFQRVDQDLVAAAHAEVIAACNARRPRRTSVGQAAVLRRESEKQRRHMPVRHLLQQTRDVVRLVKPCFMMSPLTVSQFLPPEFEFDVVVFDEASQVLPQDAVNSVYRGKALIVAGDQKQLPPTSFFTAAGDSDDGDDWDEDATDGFESILDMCKASGVLRGLPLRWHYRSRHENLIAFSNHDFYDNSMVTFPGALEQGPDIGVEFIKADGVYDRGGNSDNPLEATKVAQRVIHHFDTRPKHTLGVVALSKAQAEAIEEAVQKARAARPDLDHHFTEGRLDGFFIKNLETVQGDERDVIILSIGYGPDHRGKLLSTFGPINREGGWRRLNVAVTRARRRMEVIASFHGGDLPDSANKSVQHLKRYLQYAQHGPAILQTEAADPDAAPESPFEEEVIDVLRGWGYEVQPQVGVAGFRIDMAVRHPGAPGTYALGIECDGAMYHSSRAARDRDRLREAVLRDLGWRLHRIWGTDWYRNRRDAMARLRAAVEAACAEDPHAVRVAPPVGAAGSGGNLGDGGSTAEVVDGPLSARGGEPAAMAGGPAVPRVEFVTVDAGPAPWSRPYHEVDLDLLAEVRDRSSSQRGMWGVDLQDPAALDVVADVALCVIEVEGPVEKEVIYTRVRLAWGLGRAGQVVRDRIDRALRRLLKQGKIVHVGAAYDRPGHETEFARTPTERCARRVAEVPVAERQLVLRNVVDEGPGVQREDLLREAARFFGWARLGADIRDALTGDIDTLIGAGDLIESEGGLMPAEGS
jgi:very-short-patch-repair endonuclease